MDDIRPWHQLFGLSWADFFQGTCVQQAGPSMRDLPPEEQFRLFAVTVRSPRELTRQMLLTVVGPGVYEARHFTGVVRVVVIHELPRQPQNAMFHLFAANQELVVYGATHYEPHSDETSTLLMQLVARYRGEGLPMAETLQEFGRRARKEVLQSATPEELEDYLSAIPPEERLAGLPPEELLAALSPEQRAALAQLLQAASPPNDKAE